MPDLPKGPVVVVGAGYISLEFSGIYNGMGKDVHLFYRKPLPLVGYVCTLLCTKVQLAMSQTGNTAGCIGLHVGLHFPCWCTASGHGCLCRIQTEGRINQLQACR